MKISHLPRACACALIRLYQKTLSPDHGPLHFLFPYGACKFHPSCSVYALQSIMTHGLLKGGWLTIKRLGRCHPWSAGGHDPVPLVK